MSIYGSSAFSHLHLLSVDGEGGRQRIGYFIPQVTYMHMRVAINASQELKKIFKMFSFLYGNPWPSAVTQHSPPCKVSPRHSIPF
jgi:hypothetical protein